MDAENAPLSDWTIEVAHRDDLAADAGNDPFARAILADLHMAGFSHITSISTSKVFLLRGTVDEAAVADLASHLFADRVTETFDIRAGLAARGDRSPVIEVHPLPGVMNPEAQSALRAAERRLDHADVRELQTGRRYVIEGVRSADELDDIARRFLANDCIETWYIEGFGRHDVLPSTFPEPPVRAFELRRIAIRELDQDALDRLSRDGHLFLSSVEMATLQSYYRDLARDPTDLELETIAQTWSEHCVHKTLKSAVAYSGDDFGRDGEVSVRFENLLAETIAGATRTLDRDWCLSVFVDNAGIIAFDEEYGIAFKAETHNHPSAIEPYGGAATGIGGCIRDIMGCGLGAKPIASTDVFCVAPPDFAFDRLPQGVLHPRRVLKGVVSGVRDYGNRMGIPTVNGAVYFDERYLANPLVFCGCVGLIPRDRIVKEPVVGDAIVVAGGRTGRDGIHGATFSSAELTDEAADEFSHAVQIGNAIEEKKLLDAQLLARDHESGCLFHAVTDCGAGGLSSAVGEMAEDLGADVQLRDVPLKYAGLRYDEIWISEAQERMVFAVPQDKVETLIELFRKEDVDATVIGRFTGDGMLRVRYGETLVGEMDMRFLHGGLPKRELTATWRRKRGHATRSYPALETGGSLDNRRLLDALSDLQTASREQIIRQYDHEVQGRSVVKPLVGPEHGPSDAAVLRPRYGSSRGIAISCGLCPSEGDEDPYMMAILAIDEAYRNALCVGADPDRIAILDNFCWPKVDREDSLGALVRTCRGAHDAAVAYGLPFVSGKDSLNNEFVMSAKEAARTGLPERLAIPYTLLISALGIVEDVTRCVTMDFKLPGHVIAVISAPVDVVGLAEARANHQRVSDLIRSGKVFSAHDVSDGGLAVAIAEMSIASGLGAEISLAAQAYSHSTFAAVAGTYVVEVAPETAEAEGLSVIGTVSDKASVKLGIGGSAGLDISVSELAKAWRNGLSRL